jgi:hypothetical protein
VPARYIFFANVPVKMRENSDNLDIWQTHFYGPVSILPHSFPLGKDVVNMLLLSWKWDGDGMVGMGMMPNGPIRAKQVNQSSYMIG